MRDHIFKTLAQAKRLVIIVIGFTVLAIGIAMIALPGPAIVVIPVGLGILATEFIWARRLLVLLKERLSRFRNGNGKDNKKGDSDVRHP